MPRKRDISPCIWRSAQFLDLASDATRLVFIAAFSLADDLGVGLIADLRRYTGLEDIDRHIADVAAQGLVVPYDIVDGAEQRPFYLLPTWCRYQYVNRPTKSSNPLPGCWRDVIPVEFHPKYEQRARDTTAPHPAECALPTTAGSISDESPGASVIAHGGLTEDAQSPHGGLTEPHGAPSPSPSPSPKNPLSESGADPNIVARFRDLWNREVKGFNVRKLYARRDAALPKHIRQFLRDCEGDWDLVESSVRAFVRQGFHRDRDPATKLGIDTFLRPSHRADYIERGRDFHESGPTSTPLDDTVDRLKAQLQKAEAERSDSTLRIGDPA